jgi:DNA-binding PadR family transcriptional regulator
MSYDTVSISFPAQRPRISLTALFILGLLNRGDSIALYDLKAHALVSPGKVAPALHFLRQRKLIEEVRGGRDRIDYVITDEGRKALSDHWLEFASSRPRDLSQRLMVAWLPLALGKREEAIQLLMAWAGVPRAEASRLRNWSGNPRGSLLQSFGETYRRIKVESLLTEAASLEKIAEEMKSGEGH